MRKTNYGTYAEGDELNENEKALNKIVECAESVGIEVAEGKTAISIPFVAEVIERLEAENKHLKKENEGLRRVSISLEEYEKLVQNGVSSEDIDKWCINEMRKTLCTYYADKMMNVDEVER